VSHSAFKWILFSPSQAFVSHVRWAGLEKHTHKKRVMTSSCNSSDSSAQSDLGTDEHKKHNVSQHLMTRVRDLSVHVSGLVSVFQGKEGLHMAVAQRELRELLTSKLLRASCV